MSTYHLHCSRRWGLYGQMQIKNKRLNFPCWKSGRGLPPSPCSFRISFSALSKCRQIFLMAEEASCRLTYQDYFSGTWKPSLWNAIIKKRMLCLLVSWEEEGLTSFVTRLQIAKPTCGKKVWVHLALWRVRFLSVFAICLLVACDVHHILA